MTTLNTMGWVCYFRAGGLEHSPGAFFFCGHFVFSAHPRRFGEKKWRKITRPNLRITTAKKKFGVRGWHQESFLKIWDKSNKKVNLFFYKQVCEKTSTHWSNDLQTTLWTTQRCFYSFQTFRRSTPSSVKIVFYGMGTVVDLCTKALIVETFEKNKNIFVSPIASFVNHCYNYEGAL